LFLLEHGNQVVGILANIGRNVVQVLAPGCGGHLLPGLLRFIGGVDSFPAFV